MKIKTTDLTGPALNWAVAKCWYSDRSVELTEGKTGVRVLRDPTYDGSEHHHWFVFFGSEYWDQAGPIIDQRRIFLTPGSENMWPSARTRTTDGRDTGWINGETMLIAAMRCFVISELGDEVDIPEELLT